MATIIDRAGPLFLKDGSWRQYTVIRAQNIADYLYVGNEKENWDFSRDFPNIAPPSPRLCFEWNSTEIINSDGKELRGFPKTRYCVFVNSERNADGDGWICWGRVVFEFADTGKLIDMGGISWAVDGDGLPMNRDEKGRFLFSLIRAEDQQEQINWISSSMYVPWLALCFMNCKNVTVDGSPPPSLALRKSWQRAAREPRMRWHVLNISPMKKIIRESNDGDESLSPKALHICRGHFKNYGERGLFGKYKGNYWWPMHTRGNEAAGTVSKDYRVIPGDAS